jgi:uncharacterized membrane protein YuzA (DUF378 family)
MLFGMLIFCVGLRLGLGESRVAWLVSQGPLEVGWRILSAPIFGLFVGAKIVVLAVMRGYEAASGLLLGMGVLGATVSGYAALKTGRLPADAEAAAGGAKVKPGPWRVLFFGVSLVALSYLTAIRQEHFPPLQEMGRLTSVHHSAAIGWGLVVASLLMAILGCRQRLARVAAAVLIGVAGVALLSASIDIQHRYVAKWEEQREFWRSFRKLCPDIRDGTRILLEDSGLSHTRAPIEAFSWTLPFVLPMLDTNFLRMSRVPRVYGVSDLADMRSEANALRATWVGWYDVVIDPEDVIVLRYEGGRLIRADGPVTIAGTQVISRKIDAGASGWSETKVGTPLGMLLLGDGQAPMTEIGTQERSDVLKLILEPRNG